MQTPLAIALLAALPCACLFFAWWLSWRTRRMKAEGRVVRAIGLMAALIAGPGLVVWLLTADEDGESSIAVGASALMALVVTVMVARILVTTGLRIRARLAVVGGRDVDRAIAWMRRERDRTRLRMRPEHAPQVAETTAEDAITIAAIGRHAEAEELLAGAGAPSVLAIRAYEQTLGALRALGHASRGELDDADDALPDDEAIVPSEAGRIWDVVGATAALVATLRGETERGLRLAAAREGERPFAHALRTLARAHAAAARADRETALREIAALRASRFPAVIERYPGPATQLARAEGPYRG